MNKVPVEVEIEERSDGEIIPRAIIWSDGRRFPISRVLYHGASSANEYEGIRYTVLNTPTGMVHIDRADGAR